MTPLFYLLLITAAPVAAAGLAWLVAGTRAEQLLTVLLPEDRQEEQAC